MIVVSVRLVSAIDRSRDRELARLEITNDGEGDNPNRGNYTVRSLRGRSKEQLDKRNTQRLGRVLNHARLAEHVWNLVAKALKALKYGEVDGTGL